LIQVKRREGLSPKHGSVNGAGSLNKGNGSLGGRNSGSRATGGDPTKPDEAAPPAVVYEWKDLTIVSTV
jgi:hypothetical protein